VPELAVGSLDDGITQDTQMIDKRWEFSRVAFVFDRGKVHSSFTHTAKVYVTRLTLLGL
jgi:hypothetical protein